MPDANNPLQLDLDFYKALFNDTGQYFLKISIQGSPENQDAVKLYINQSKTGLSQSQHVTDQCFQGDAGEPIRLPDSKMTFHLPQGFMEQEVLLFVEAYKLSVNHPLEAEQKYGEAIFSVYPPRNSLFAAKMPPETRPGEKHILYDLEKQLPLTTEESGLNGLPINVGILWLNVVLKTADEESLQQKSSTPAKTFDQNETESINSFVEVPGPSLLKKMVKSIPSTPATASGNITESPLGPLSSSVHPRHLCGSYVAREGYCEVAILVHAAVGLPSKSDGRPPQPYITGKSKRDHSRGLQAQSVTHTSIQPTHLPTWNEVLLIEFPQDDMKQEEVFLCIADHPSKEVLVDYRIPVSQLKPFYPYNLELVKPNQDLDSSARLYVSFILKHDKLTKPVDSSGKIFGLELLLRGFESPISNQAGPLIAVSKIVDDWNEYKEKMLTANPCAASVTMTTIGFPSPHPTSFSVASASPSYGAPQVTVCGDPYHQPQWNQMFYFPGDVKMLFPNKASLVLEFYTASQALSSSGWLLSNPVGYCHQILDMSLASALQQQNALMGLRLNGLPLQGILTTPTGRKGSVGIVLRLLTDERPDALVSASQFSSLPAFNEAQEISHHSGERFAPHPITTTEKNPFGLPPFDAVQQILPLRKTGASAEPLMSHNTKQPLTTYKANPNEDPTSVPLELRNTMDLRTLALLDYQMKEVDRYRTAMRKLAADLLHLKQENARLEEANSQYRRDLNQHDEISRIMVGSNELDNVTHSELIQKFVLLKKKLSDESTKRQELQKRTQKLQNELIKKNEREKDSVKLQAAHESQQALLQKMQSKLQKYNAVQETCKKQEKVIIELEKILANGTSDTNLSDGKGVNKAYIEENTRLRLELEKYKENQNGKNTKHLSVRNVSPEMDTKDLMPISEKLELYHKLERSEGRILGLEKQLAENARQWAREKTKLQAKLNEMVMEQQAGFTNHFTQDTRYSPDINFNSSNNVLFSGSRKPSPKLDPLTRKRP